MDNAEIASNNESISLCESVISMDKVIAVGFITACLSFGVGVVMILILTIRASTQVRGSIIDRLKLDATWPISVLRDKAWSSTRDRQYARVGRWCFIGAGVGIGLFLLADSLLHR